MLKYRVHTLRTGVQHVQAINCIACWKEAGKIALGREEDFPRLEIWNVACNPFIESIIYHEEEDVSLAGVCWAKGRLFSTGFQGTVIEYSLTTRQPLHSSPVTGGPAWCIATNNLETHLAVGSEEGCVTLFSLQKDELVIEKWIKPFNSRIVSLTWGPTKEYLFSASENRIKMWNVDTDSGEEEFILPASHEGRRVSVWAVAVSKNLTVVAGDSRGHVSFWDKRTQAPTDCFQSHKGDVLCLTFDESGQNLYAAGVDPIIVQFCLVECKTHVGNKWAKSIQRQLHTHDVRAMCLVGSTLYSGGVDTYLQRSSYPPLTCSKYPPHLQHPMVHLCRDLRVLTLCRPKQLEVWCMGATFTTATSQPLPVLKQPEKWANIEPRTKEAITCNAISPSGKWIAFTTSKRTTVCVIELEKNEVQLDGLHFVTQSLDPAYQLAFLKDENLVLASSRSSNLQLIRLGDTTASVTCSVPTSCAVYLMTVSKCSRFVAVADVTGRVLVYKSEKLKLHSAVPAYQNMPSAMAFHPGTCHLWVAYMDKNVVEYDVEEKEYTAFSRLLQGNFPKLWMDHRFPIVTIEFDQKQLSLVILHDNELICIFDVGKCQVVLKSNQASKKSKNSKGHKEEEVVESAYELRLNDYCDGFHVTQRFKHLIYFAPVSGKEAIAVEINMHDLENHLPPAITKKMFGV